MHWRQALCRVMCGSMCTHPQSNDSTPYCVPAGTVMRGGMRVGDTLELPELRQQKKIKSMQMFRWVELATAASSCPVLAET